MSIHFSLYQNLADSQPSLYQNSRWLYLGKNSQNLASAIGVLGAQGKLVLGDKFHRVTQEIRQPFLDFVGTFGSRQKNTIGWWASSFSWKEASSDLFLLTSYLKLSERLVSEWASRPEEKLFVWVEDPWLYADLKINFGACAGVRFGDSSLRNEWRLFKIKTRWACLGVLKRLRWASRVSYQFRLQKRLSGLEQPSSPKQVAIYSLPQKRTLVGEHGWYDPYLEGLDKILDRAQIQYWRFGPPSILGFEQELSQRTDYFWPLILNFKFSSFLRSVFFIWFPNWKSGDGAEDWRLGNLRLKFILKREWWYDSSFASWAHFRFFLDCFSAFLEQHSIQTVIFPWENQPWEKMIVIAAKKLGVKSIGYQHATVPALLLPHFHGEDEASRTPLPDLILSAGEFTMNRLIEGHMPREKLQLGGSLRYRSQSDTIQAPKLEDQPPIHKVLLILPLEPNAVRAFLMALARAFPDQGKSDGIEFFAKPHPVYPYSLTELTKIFEIPHLTGSFQDAVDQCGTVLFDSSTAGFEAWMLGRNTLRLRPELLVDYDPCDFLTHDEVPVCEENDLREKILFRIKKQRTEIATLERITQCRELLFAPVAEDVWIDTIRKATHVGTNR